MSLSVKLVLRRISSNSIRKLSTVAEVKCSQEEPLAIFRTNEHNPCNHTKEHLNRLYTISSEEKDRIFQGGGFTKRFQLDIKTFAECSIMVRKPAVEIISCLRRTDYNRPVNKYVIYGKEGCGKTISLAHILHYGHVTKHVLIHIPWLMHWFRNPHEISTSTFREGLADIPIEAAAWLAHFRYQNKYLLQEQDLKISKNYVWSQREETAAGARILEIVNFGINRIKFASEVIYVLLEELKQASIAGKCKTMVLVDGFNAFFSDYTEIKDINTKRFVKANQVTLTNAFLNITKNDWNHGAVVVTVDNEAVKDRQHSCLPRCLLHEEGFEHLDPFIPVGVGNYDEVEFEMIMEYYKDRKWIRDITPKGQREIQLITNSNPRKLSEFLERI